MGYSADCRVARQMDHRVLAAAAPPPSPPLPPPPSFTSAAAAPLLHLRCRRPLRRRRCVTRLGTLAALLPRVRRCGLSVSAALAAHRAALAAHRAALAAIGRPRCRHAIALERRVGTQQPQVLDARAVHHEDSLAREGTPSTW